MIHIYSLLVNNYAEKAFSIGKIFVGVSLLQTSCESFHITIVGLNYLFPKIHSSSTFEYNYNYYKHLLPYLAIGCISGTFIGTGFCELMNI